MNSNLSFESILKKDNNWILFKQLFKDELSQDTIHEVEKMLNCCTPECGFATYICTYCGKTKTVPFSCKSKLCSRCGKKYVDIWSQLTSQKLLNCHHRHIVLSLSDKLWPFFVNNLSLQKLLLDTAAKVIKNVFSRKQKLTIGLILVLHPFGDDLKPNFHVHAIVTAGGLSQDTTQFINLNYIDYTVIRKTWQYQILTALRKYLPQYKTSLDPIIDWCFKNRTNGFIVFAHSIITHSKKDALGYVVRYTRHPAISKRRILSYDGTHVTFSYEAYGKKFTRKMYKFAFIKAVLQHAAAKQFKTVRRFGLYSRRSLQKYELAKSLLHQQPTPILPEFNWRRNLTAFTTKDPLVCDHCARELELFRITYTDKFGSLKTIDKDVWFYETSPPQPLQHIPEHETQKERQICMSEVSY